VINTFIHSFEIATAGPSTDVFKLLGTRLIEETAISQRKVSRVKKKFACCDLPHQTQIIHEKFVMILLVEVLSHLHWFDHPNI